MEKKSYTPGPWEWWTSNSFLRLSSKVTGKDGGVIDSYRMSDGHTSLSVKYEDMALIAAAPELLESLQSCIEWLDIHAPAGSAESLCITDSRAAIAKALGKEQS